MKKAIVLILVCAQTMMLSVMASSTMALTWTPAVLIETGTGPVRGSPKIAVDPSGNVMAVWVQDEVEGMHIYANLYVVGSGWGSPTLLETSIMYADSPQIAADSNGNFIAVWRQAWTQFNASGAGGRYGIYANRYVAGTGWGTATGVYVDTTRDYVSADAPQIAIEPNGNAMAVWTLYSWANNHFDSLASRYVVGTGWGAASTMETGGDNATSPKVALDSVGNAFVVWRGSGASPGIYVNRYVVGTGWGAPARVDTSLADADWWGADPKIAADKDGNAIAVWSPTGKSGISVNRYAAGIGWGTAEAISDSSACGGNEGVQVAFDKDGNAMAVWNDAGWYCPTKLYANRYVAGTGWGTTDMVGSCQYSEQIAFDPNGNAIAVWVKCDPCNIWASQYVVGTGWGASAMINTPDWAGVPQIVIDNNGNATVVWVQYDSIYASNLCTYAINPANATLNGSAETGTITITSVAGSCAWTATSNASWITITSGASGSGSGTVSYSIAVNTTVSARTGTMTIGGQTFTVTQSAVTYTQTQLDEAVAAADAAKDLIIAEKDQTISALNTTISSKDQTIAAMFTQQQLNQAVAEERIKWDVNNDGKIGFAEVIYILQTLVGVR